MKNIVVALYALIMMGAFYMNIHTTLEVGKITVATHIMIWGFATINWMYTWALTRATPNGMTTEEIEVYSKKIANDILKELSKQEELSKQGHPKEGGNRG